MHSTLVIALLNTAFWFALHFGIAELLTHLPASARTLVAADSSGKLLPRRKKRMNPTSEA